MLTNYHMYRRLPTVTLVFDEVFTCDELLSFFV